jgi:hypothetical protein
MHAWLRRSVWVALLSLAAVTPALAQRIGGYDPSSGTPCTGQPLKCIGSPAAPDTNAAINGVQRVYAQYICDSGPHVGAKMAGCGTAWYVNRPTIVGNVQYATFVTAKHVLDFFDTPNNPTDHYTATFVQLEFFYKPLPTRACGVLANNECHLFAADCTTPTIVSAPCWDWDNTCDLGRIFIAPANVPAGAAPLALAGFDAAAGTVCWIPQHPMGRCLEWDSGLIINNPAGCNFSHQISTQGGSSGAPVLYTGNLVVGVHVAGTLAAACDANNPNTAVYQSQLNRFLGAPVASNCLPTETHRRSWGQLKTIFR